MIKKIIFKSFLGIIVVCCFVSTVEIAEVVVADNSKKEDRKILLGQVRKSTEKKHKPVQGSITKETIAKQQEEFGKYIVLLDKLAVASVRKDANEALATSEIDLENSILAIAQNYHTDPNLINELITEYGYWKGDKRFQPVVLRPRALKDKHVTEKYRLAWETLLLAPTTHEIRFMERRIFEALESIGSLESVPVIVESFRLTTLEDIPQGRKIVDRQTEIIMVLALWPEERTLTGLFTCLELVDKRNEGQIPTKTHNGYTLRQKVFRYLADPDNRGITESEKRRLVRARKWKEVVNRYSKPVKSKENKQLFEKVKSRTLPEVQN